MTRKSARKARRRSRAVQDAPLEPDSDETFALIVGYTSGGAPFGVTWEELEEDNGSREPDDSNPF